MEILKIATEWAKAEVFSSRFFVLFALLFLIGSIGFWQLGKTETAKAYTIPTVVVVVVVVVVGHIRYQQIQSYELCRGLPC